MGFRREVTVEEVVIIRSFDGVWGWWLCRKKTVIVYMTWMREGLEPTRLKGPQVQINHIASISQHQSRPASKSEDSIYQKRKTKGSR